MTPIAAFHQGIDYLLQGSATQQHAYHTLQELRIFTILQEYSPVLVGTVPIDINIDDSDLDIICEVYHFTDFQVIVDHYFSRMRGYRYTYKLVEGVPRAVCSFHYNDWLIQLFAQPVAAVQQYGYKHMVVEHRILQLIDSSFRQQIRALKASGVKTEPAFAKLLQLEGDPYAALLELFDWSDEQLMQLLDKTIGKGDD
ncbi:alpha/beta hydrolase [Paenibacillus montaniterrae]|uniref:Alpha/beta hydrolase n=2 Tax=Paenibacillus montaniterrae TaxID=429341 RepID=A0A920D014_9BACL|nr:alpha/beta hydrolase [Paenibacillus montaniterrae]